MYYQEIGHWLIIIIDQLRYLFRVLDLEVGLVIIRLGLGLFVFGLLSGSLISLVIVVGRLRV